MVDKTLGPKTENRVLREAQNAFKDVETLRPLTDQEKDRRAFDANRERLKAERLAREAAATKKGK